MALGQILGVGGSLLGGVLGSNAAKKAAETQANIAQNQLGIEANIHQITSNLLKPWRKAAYRANSILDYELGHGERPTFGGTAPKIVEFDDTPVVQQQPQQVIPTGSHNDEFRARFPGQTVNALAAPQDPVTRFRVNDQVFDTREAAQKYANANRTGGEEYGGYELSPDYQYLQDQAIQGVDSSAASRGTLNSGATLKAVQDRAANIASLGRNAYLDRLTAQSNAGQAATVHQATAGSNFAAGAGSALSGYGNAVAAGQIGSFNALSGGINNAIGTYNYLNNLEGQNNKNSGIFSGLNNSVNTLSNWFSG